MKISRFGKAGVVGVAFAGLAAFAVGLAGNASADPTTTFVAVGSDTIQDFYNNFASSISPGQLGSWDATNPGDSTATGVHQDISPAAGCHLTRPNGSGEGVNALRKSINPASVAFTLADAPEPGCITIARSSSGPAQTDISTKGLLTYVPFALDAVSGATGPSAAVTGSDAAVKTNIVDADAFTLDNLKSMYGSGQAVTVGGHRYNPVGGPSAVQSGDIKIELKVPQAGSGTRSFWATTMGFSATTLPAWIKDTWTDSGGTHSVEEHDGTVYANDANAFGPFSIAQFVAQSGGINPRLHHVAIHKLNNVAPTVGGSLNPDFPVTRDVYSVVDTKSVTSPADPSLDSGDHTAFNSKLAALLVGSNSTLCQSSFAIQTYGFATIDNCGDTSLRALPTFSAL